MDVQLDGVPAATATVDGARLIRHLLDAHANAAVAVVDVAKNLGAARELLARSGIDIGDHEALQGTVAAGFVAPADAWMVSGALLDAARRGFAARVVHLRDGREATFHLVKLDEPHLSTGLVLVIVPHAPGAFAEPATPGEADVAARVGVLHTDGTGAVIRAEDSVLSVVGRERVRVEGHPVISIVHPDDQETAIVHWVAAKEERGVAHRWRSRVIRGDDSVFWAEITITNRIDDAGDGDVRIEINDISREVAAAEALAKEQSLLKELTETLPVGVAKFDADGRIEYVNEQLARLLGRDPAVVIARAINGEIAQLAGAFTELLGEGRSSRVVTARRRDDLDRDLEWTLRAVTSATGAVAGGVLCVADVTEATELRAALEERATTDALTGCLNWAGTVGCLQAALGSASPGSGVGLLFIDLDGFKQINDRHGHAVGDRVLEIVARRARGAVRPLDHIGRLGGDEFVVVAPGLPSIETARALAGRVSDAIGGVAEIDDLRVEIAASIGVAWADSGDADVLLAEADRAMYAAKRASSSSLRQLRAGARTDRRRTRP
jgi:diguanylate cyclase (GGDEF)-like protein/PAS domain S-box-containing protein